jgi:predicted HTH domain antitoxin
MSVVIPDEVLEIARMSAQELKQEIAILLYSQGRLTMAQAGRLADMERIQFQHLLASREIPVNYDVAEFESDIETLHRLKRL